MHGYIGECVRAHLAHARDIRSQNLSDTLVVAEHVNHLASDNGDRHRCLLNKLFLARCRLDNGSASLSQSVNHVDEAYGVLK